MDLNSTKELISEIKKGNMVLLMDDEDRENEGDLILAGEKVTPEKINFMAKHARGLICLAMSQNKCAALNLNQMVNDNKSGHGTGFTVSIEAATGITTGISAADRARTIAVASKAKAKASDIVSPGHIFPVRAVPGGVLSRTGHTEGSTDLCRLAGLTESAVICEVMNEDGTMARYNDLIPFAKKHKLKIAKIEDLISYRLKNERLIKNISTKKIKIKKFGNFDIKTFKNKLDGLEHYALIKGKININKSTRVRVISTDIPSSFFNFNKNIFKNSIKYLNKFGNFALILVTGSNPKPISSENNRILRYYGVGAQIIKELKIKKMILVSRVKKRIIALKGYGIEIKKQEIIK